MSERFGGRDYNLVHRSTKGEDTPQLTATSQENAVIASVINSTGSETTRREVEAAFRRELKLVPEMYEYLREQSELAYKVVSMHTILGMNATQIGEVLFCDCDPNGKCRKRCGDNPCSRGYVHEAYIIGILMLREKWGATVADCKEATRVLNALTTNLNNYYKRVEWLTVKQACEIYDIGKSSLYRAIESGELELQIRKVSGKKQGVMRHADLRDYLRSRKVIDEGNAGSDGTNPKQEEYVPTQRQLHRSGPCNVHTAGRKGQAKRDPAPDYRAVA